MEKIICKECGKVFRDYKSNQRSYCSVKCGNIGKITSATTACGECGKKFKSWKSSRRKYCSVACMSEGHKKIMGEKTTQWKGGRIIDNGYVKLIVPGHPCANNNYVREHRLVMEAQLGRYLVPEEHVHHINEVKTDNRLENLQVVSREEHRKLHEANKDT